jgi:hypothetical protein
MSVIAPADTVLHQTTKDWHGGHVTLSPSTGLRINSAKGLAERFFALLNNDKVGWLHRKVSPCHVFRFHS